MAIDDPLAPSTQPLSPSMQTQVSVQATSATPAQAAAAVQDVTGGLEQDLVSDASRNFGPYRYFLLGVLAFLVVYALVLYAVILLGYVLDGNERAHGILTSLGGHAAVIALPFAGYVAGWLTPTPKVAKTSTPKG